MTYICYDINHGATQNQYFKYHINPWNSLQDIRQTRWSPWPYYTEWWCDKHVWCPSFFIKKLFVQTNCNILLYCGINPWNSLQNIRQNHLSLKIRSQWPWPRYTECWCDKHVWCRASVKRTYGVYYALRLPPDVQIEFQRRTADFRNFFCPSEIDTRDVQKLSKGRPLLTSCMMFAPPTFRKFATCVDWALRTSNFSLAGVLLTAVSSVASSDGCVITVCICHACWVD